MIGELCAGIDAEAHPLFAQQESPRKALVIPMTSDRGLCGGFNATVARRVTKLLTEQSPGFDEITVSPLGKKGGGFARREGLPTLADLDGLRAETHAESAKAIAAEAVRLFLDTEVDAVFVIYNEFVSAMTQEVVVQQLLPLDPDSFDDIPSDAGASRDFIFEPGEEELLMALLPRFIRTQVLSALLESDASEMGARMTAMDNATTNATDLIDRLTLQINRARQAIITTELMEITSGAESLKG
jgi:F-type H+-transporting ATPase subunit gamma